MTTRKSLALAAGLAFAAGLMFAPRASATDGVTLITQATAKTGLPGCPNDGASLITICNPGSYRLASNLQVTGPHNGVDINSPQVTLDLNGFTISTTPGQGTNGIYTGVSGVEILNGRIAGFDTGISAGANELAGQIKQVTVRDINASFNGTGIAITSGQIIDSVASNCVNAGIAMVQGFIRGATTDNNNGDGMDLGSDNAQGLFGGIVPLPSPITVMVQNSLASGNGGYGIRISFPPSGTDFSSGGFSVTGSSVGGNQTGGIAASAGAIVSYGRDVFVDNPTDVSGPSVLSLDDNICSNGFVC